MCILIVELILINLGNGKEYIDQRCDERNLSIGLGSILVQYNCMIASLLFLVFILFVFYSFVLE